MVMALKTCKIFSLQISSLVFLMQYLSPAFLSARYRSDCAIFFLVWNRLLSPIFDELVGLLFRMFWFCFCALLLVVNQRWRNVFIYRIVLLVPFNSNKLCDWSKNTRNHQSVKLEWMIRMMKREIGMNDSNDSNHKIWDFLLRHEVGLDVKERFWRFWLIY